MAIYLGLSFLLRLTILTKKLNVSFEIPFNIILGLILGPFKGAFLAILADTLNLLITSSIATWMIEYAIIPPFTAILSWLLFYIYQLKNKLSFITIFSIFIITISTLIIIYFSEVINGANQVKIENLSKDIRQIFTKELVLILIISFSSISLIILISFSILYFKTKKEIYYLIIFIFSVVLTIVILLRWLWGPYAFIKYYNRFIGIKNNKLREINQYFYFYLTPIILKGLITIPIYCVFLISLTPILIKLKKRYDTNNYDSYHKIKSTYY
ncbi:ECF transporter S component [Mesomycoplasma lagogenitalium]|uniref:ECF transporter S component n=1 Tax=Mesomycoplasma lagogenitalium TaxID=171286 RepID=A0ABY8LUH6_9BACT|nr:ECF transporter S component [Mesomycoplasma lagogenitalium]WGI36884.1 ECF transporter S component [Mesomycoplasma lagogenitalium]